MAKKCKKVKSKKNNDRIVTHLVVEDDEMVVISLDELLEESFDKDKCLLTLSTDSELREWGLSIRTCDYLSRAGIKTLKQLFNTSCLSLIKIKQMGRESFKEILELMSWSFKKFIPNKIDNQIKK